MKRVSSKVNGNLARPDEDLDLDGSMTLGYAALIWFSLRGQ
jgi:hypothetical protein